MANGPIVKKLGMKHKTGTDRRGRASAHAFFQRMHMQARQARQGGRGEEGWKGQRRWRAEGGQRLTTKKTPTTEGTRLGRI